MVRADGTCGWYVRMVRAAPRVTRVRVWLGIEVMTLIRENSISIGNTKINLFVA